MPRSGGTLLYQLTKEIAEYSGLATGKGFPKERYKNGVVKTDTCDDWMIERVKSGQAIAFGTYRDFRDIVVSLQKFYTRRDKERFGKIKQWTVGGVLEYRPDILDIYYRWQPLATWFRYEDSNFKRNAIKEISKHLNVELTHRDIQHIIDKYSRQANDNRIKKQKHWMDAGSGSMLTKIHISETRGRSTWREVLSKEDLAKIESIAGDWLKEHDYE